MVVFSPGLRRWALPRVVGGIVRASRPSPATYGNQEGDDGQGFPPVPGTARARFALRGHPGQEAGEPRRVRADRPPGPPGTRGKVPGAPPRAAAESQVR